MTTRTTIRLSEEQQLQLRKMALVRGSQTAVISRALACYWAEVGDVAEQLWALVEQGATAGREGDE